LDTISLCIHVLLAAILVGPQFLLFYAVIPSTWLIEDEGLRRSVTQVVTRRFGMLSGISLLGLIITGLYQFYSDGIVPDDVRENMMDYRWGLIFSAKMTLLLVLIALMFVHGLVFGRRIRAASEAVERGEADAGTLESARRTSMLFSTLIILVSVAIICLGVALGFAPYSMVQR
jgi:uncharacterized membrane protein